jgi:putative autoinducer-2 (AI-2) aldolase
MADATGNIDAKNYGFDVPVEKKAFFLKGLDNYDWGIKDRMSRIFDSKSGNTVMLAFDHGYIMGPTSGLERIDLGIIPLTEYADCLMCTRGVLRSCVPPEVNKPISLRVSAGTTVLTELNDECLMAIEDAISLNASAMAAMVSVGGKYEATTIRNLTKLVDLGMKYSIPVLGVTAVGKDLARDARYISMATRVCAENGATFVKTYYCEKDFAKVVAACPVPIVIAGGKKIPENEALQVAYNAINDGASGVDMGRNVFQAGDPIAMIKAVRAVVHNGEKADKAFQMYNDLKK